MRPDTAPLAAPVLERIVGQPRAKAVLAASVAAPVHAYLFLGPPGAGKRDAALAFAAALICPDFGCGTCEHCRAVLEGAHPDVVVFERSGASLLVKDADAVVSLAQRSPRAARRQVVVLSDFHLVDEAAPRLLKTIEEPPSTTIFVLLAETIPLALVTIASRCLRVEFSSQSREAIEAILCAEGVAPAVAAIAADAAGGRLDRARLLADDAGFGARQALWASVPDRLDGTGATVVTLANELLASCEELVGVVRKRQEEELAQLTEEARRAGLRQIPGRQAVEDRHRRDQRRVRTDELRAGLASLSAAYRRRLEAHNLAPRRLATMTRAQQRIDEVATSLVRNPNELLLLEALLLDLDALG